jgi:hypothetical protein
MAYKPVMARLTVSISAPSQLKGEDHMQHSFVVGNIYPSHRGKFKVLRIENDKMWIRFDDGREVETDIRLQQRIVDNYDEVGEISDE